MAVKEFFKQNKTEQFLIFSLGGKKYGVSALKIIGVIGMPEIPPQNKIMDLIVVRIQDHVIPVFHLKSILKGSQIEYNENSCILLIKSSNKTATPFIGLVIDSAEMVCEIQTSNIRKFAFFESPTNKTLITGMVNLDGNSVEIINIDKIIKMKEIAGFFDE